MKKKFTNYRLSMLLFILINSSVSFADLETDRAIEEVQKMMESPEFQKNAAKDNKEAAAVADHVKTISGNPQNEQDIYKLAAEVLGNMKGMTPEQMTRLLEQASKDPAAFAKTWSPEQLAKLKELSGRLPAAQNKKP
jgi:hypothetical protein